MDSLKSSKQQNAYPKQAPPLEPSIFKDDQEQKQMHITDFQDITFDPVVEAGKDNASEQFYEDQQLQNCSTGTSEETNSNTTLKVNKNPSSPIIEECHNNSNNNEPGETRTEIHSNDDRLEDQQEDANDDEDEFVALCTDASLVLNNDQSQSCYTNELYQPMKNGNQPVEDEYLLYQELRFIESQEPSRGEQGLTKILEGDEGDVDEDESEHDHDQDAFDRLQLTNIIDAFGYPWSPLIDNCRPSSRDPLISGVCIAQDKPDSTSHRTISPSNSSDSGGHCQVSMTNLINHYLPSSVDDHQSHQQHSQFDCNSHDELRETQYSSEINSDRSPNHINQESQQHALHEELAYNNQLCDQDNSSENSCVKPLSSTFLSEQTSGSNISSDDLSLNMNCYENQGSLDSSGKTTFNVGVQKSNGRKRSLQETVECDDAIGASSKESKATSPKSIKNRGKRKKVLSNEQQTTSQSKDNLSNNKINPINNVTSSMLNIGEQLGSVSAIDISNIINRRTNEFQRKHITNEKDECDDMTLDYDMSIEDDTASSTGGHRQPHMNKYRRRTANARERIRMREINQAFEKLKKVVPVELIQQSISGDESDQTSVSSRRNNNKSGSQQSDSQSVKLTKIATLRLAKSYIALLSDVLSQHPEGSASAIIDRASASSLSVSADPQNITPGRSQASTRAGEKATARKRRSRVAATRPSVPLDEQKKDQIITSINKNTNPRTTTGSEAGKNNPLNSDDESIRALAHQESQISPQQVQQVQHKPIMIASHNMLQQSVNNGCTSNQQQQIKQHHFAYTQCHQQPMSVSQASTGQERTFITPVAVAILGIPNQGAMDQSQTLQLLGIQGGQQLQQLQHRHQQQTIQSSPVCNMMAQQPQQVTLTLDEINGLSVLRLNNPQQAIGQGQQTIQIQPARTLLQQPQMLTNTTSQPGNYSYTAYQPIHFSQLQTSNGLAAVRPINGQQASTIHIGQRNDYSLGSDTNSSNDTRTSSIHQPQMTSEITNHQFIATTLTSPTAKTTTGNNSDFKNFGISPNIISQSLNNNSNSNVKTIAHQIKFHQQSNCSGQIQLANSKLMAVTPTSQLFQASAPQNGPSRGLIASQTTNSTNLIYITPPTSLSNINNSNNNESSLDQGNSFTAQQQNQDYQHHPQEQHQMYQIENACQRTASQKGLPDNVTKTGGGTVPNVHQFEQMKFVTQFSSQANNQIRQEQGEQQSKDKIVHNSEANIRQLVATLTTSIHPKSSEQSKSCNLDEPNNGEQQQQQLVKQQQQHKRTYRFHNYDGSMITNHLYNNNHDKQQQAQQTCKRGQQQITDQANSANQIHPSQRSRQNSLSSTCSTTSSASSSLASLSSSSPTVPMIPIMVKSPSLENSNSLSASVAASD